MAAISRAAIGSVLRVQLLDATGAGVDVSAATSVVFSLNSSNGLRVNVAATLISGGTTGWISTPITVDMLVGATMIRWQVGVTFSPSSVHWTAMEVITVEDLL